MEGILEPHKLLHGLLFLRIPLVFNQLINYKTHLTSPCVLGSESKALRRQVGTPVPGAAAGEAGGTPGGFGTTGHSSAPSGDSAPGCWPLPGAAAH